MANDTLEIKSGQLVVNGSNQLATSCSANPCTLCGSFAGSATVVTTGTGACSQSGVYPFLQIDQDFPAVGCCRFLFSKAGLGVDIVYCSTESKWYAYFGSGSLMLYGVTQIINCGGSSFDFAGLEITGSITCSGGVLSAAFVLPGLAPTCSTGTGY